MRIFTNLLRRIGFLTLMVASMYDSAQGLTFTATASGNFTASSTWLGGSVPGFLLSTDVVIIPSGITVTLDTDVSFSGSSTLTVNGILTTGGGAHALTMSSGTLSGSGTINVDKMTLNLTSGISYTGSITANMLTSTGTNISSNTALTVNHTLQLNGGYLNMTGGSLSVAAGTDINISGGSISASGSATLDLSAKYNVNYLSVSTASGAELTGSGLAKVTVNVPSGSVTLSSNLMMNDTLTLSAGTLNLNNKNLAFGINGDFASSGNGTISAGTGSDITINTGHSLSGALRFTTGSSTAHNLTINLGGSGSSVSIGSDLWLTGSLTLQSGMIDVMSHNLSILAGGNLSGGSATSYVITNGTGMLTMNLSASGSNTYYIGTNTHYAPFTVAAASGSASGDVSVSAMDNIYVNGTTGTVLSNTQPVVNVTWLVHSTASAAYNYDLTAMWSAGMEVNGFDRTHAYISHYTSGSWDMQTASAATVSGSMYSMTRAGLTSLSPFAVVGQNAQLTGVNNVVANHDNIEVYPNPAASVLYFNTKNRADNAVVYDVTGREMKSVTVVNNSISISDLPAGYYNILITGKDLKAVQHFVKE